MIFEMKEEIKKKCKTCGVPKSLDEFSPNKKSLFGVRPDCKICRTKIARQKYRYDDNYRKEVLENKTIRNRAKKAIGPWWNFSKQL